MRSIDSPSSSSLSLFLMMAFIALMMALQHLVVPLSDHTPIARQALRDIASERSVQSTLVVRGVLQIFIIRRHATGSAVEAPLQCIREVHDTQYHVAIVLRGIKLFRLRRHPLLQQSNSLFDTENNCEEQNSATSVWLNEPPKD